jgi:membrane dipeptidase
VSDGFPGLTDIHAHPALNAWLWGRNLERHWWSSTVFNPLATLSDFKMLRKGGVKVLWSALHVPETQYMQCRTLNVVAVGFKGGRMLRKKDAWICLESQRQTIELQVGKADDIRIVRSNAELDAAVADGDIAIVHTVEGGHHLGAGLAGDDLDGRLARVDTLAEWGVASLTLAHLFPNDVAGHANGIPESMNKGVIGLLCTFDAGEDPDRGLTEVGKAVLDRMIDRRIIPDITHCTPIARQEVYARVANRIPIVASHIGVHSLNGVLYNLTEADVQAIKASRGVIGVIFMPYWLKDTHPGPGLGAIWETMEQLRDWSGGTWDHVAIGTDFDGFTDPPDDCKNAGELPAIREMLADRGVAESDADKILGGNARRVLNEGWI